MTASAAIQPPRIAAYAGVMRRRQLVGNVNSDKIRLKSIFHLYLCIYISCLLKGAYICSACRRCCVHVFRRVQRQHIRATAGRLGRCACQPLIGLCGAQWTLWQRSILPANRAVSHSAPDATNQHRCDCWVDRICLGQEPLSQHLVSHSLPRLRGASPCVDKSVFK